MLAKEDAHIFFYSPGPPLLQASFQGLPKYTQTPIILKDLVH